MKLVKGINMNKKIKKESICNQSSKEVDACVSKELGHKRKFNND